MKKFIFSLIICGLAAAMFVSCDEKEDEIINPVPGPSIIHHEPDEEATVYIHGVDRNLKNLRYGIDAPLTVHEILCLDSLWLQAVALKDLGAGLHLTTTSEYFSFENHRIDTVNNRVSFLDACIRHFDEDPWLNPSSGWKDFVLVRYVPVIDSIGDITFDKDTLGYVPNQQRYDIYKKMLELKENEDWDGIYEMYENAFTFIPCTGKEYRELKERGEN
ncbi:MAG: hypothetical protein IKR17_03055 [Bacteroidales bacterium]|nr:hypothetical protein [Bacteroidales bacterium]